ELLQNIPHHASAGREGVEPVGFGALEEEEDHLHLAVVDSGVGLARGNLVINPRFQGWRLKKRWKPQTYGGGVLIHQAGEGNRLRGAEDVPCSSVHSGGGAFLQAAPVITNFKAVYQAETEGETEEALEATTRALGKSLSPTLWPTEIPGLMPRLCF
ncbi:MAG: hypothetical protein QXY83_01190, partial [Thermosphaera sp.]